MCLERIGKPDHFHLCLSLLTILLQYQCPFMTLEPHKYNENMAPTIRMLGAAKEQLEIQESFCHVNTFQAKFSPINNRHVIIALPSL